MKTRSSTSVLLMFSLFLVLGKDALGTTYSRLNFFELTQKGDCLIVGKVAKLRKAWPLIGKNDHAEIDVLEVLRGKLDKKSFPLVFRSKKKRGLWAELETGQVYIFFLKEEKGQFRLVNDIQIRSWSPAAPPINIRLRSASPVAGLDDERVTFVKKLVKVIRGDREAEKEVPGLLEILKADNRTRKHPRYYAAAVDALAQIGPPAIPALVEALEDEDPFLRHGAATALRKTGSAAVPALAQAMGAENRQVRQFAIGMFLDAASEGSQKVVELFIAEGADVNVKDRLGNTPLHVAAHSCVKEGIFKLLLAKGANVKAKNGDGETPLHMAAVSFLLETGMGEKKALDPRGVFVPMTVPWDSKKILELLLTHGADISAKNKDGVTPLFKALSKGHKGIAKFLIHNVRYKKGDTLLHEAVRFGHKEITEVLLTKGAKVNAKDSLGWTPLLWAAHRNRKEIVELLLAKGADVNARTNREKATALSLAASSGHEKIVQLLLARGADVSLKNNTGKIPLHWAAMLNRKDIAQALIVAGSSINARDALGYTPLHWAAEKGGFDVTKLLIAKGADVNAKRKDGLTPLGCAFVYGHKKVAELLRKHGCEELF